MATTTRKAKVSLLDARIRALHTSPKEALPTKRVFCTVRAILALVRDKMIDDEDSVQLSERCFTACKTLKNTFQGRSANDINELENTAMKDLERIMCEIERTLRRGSANTPYPKLDTESHVQAIQQILDVGI